MSEQDHPIGAGRRLRLVDDERVASDVCRRILIAAVALIVMSAFTVVNANAALNHHRGCPRHCH
jgi:hypothetical protein